MTAIVIFAHGSSVESANEAVRAVGRNVAASGAYQAVVTAFLELGQPDLPSAVTQLASQGASEIIVVPYFLTSGIHLQRDLPRIVEQILDIQKGISIRIAAPLDGHPALETILLERAKEAQEE